MSPAGESGDTGRSPHAGTLVIALDSSESTLRLQMAGDLDMATSPQVATALDQLDVDRTTLLVFDLRQVSFLDLTGLRTILRANDHCKSHDIHVTVVKPRGFASRVFTLSDLHRELDLVDSPATARPG